MQYQQPPPLFYVQDTNENCIPEETGTIVVYDAYCKPWLIVSEDGSIVNHHNSKMIGKDVKLGELLKKAFKPKPEEPKQQD